MAEQMMNTPSAAVLGAERAKLEASVRAQTRDSIQDQVSGVLWSNLLRAGTGISLCHVSSVCKAGRRNDVCSQQLHAASSSQAPKARCKSPGQMGRPNGGICVCSGCKVLFVTNRLIYRGCVPSSSMEMQLRWSPISGSLPQVRRSRLVSYVPVLTFTHCLFLHIGGGAAESDDGDDGGSTDPEVDVMDGVGGTDNRMRLTGEGGTLQAFHLKRKKTLARMGRRKFPESFAHLFGKYVAHWCGQLLLTLA